MTMTGADHRRDGVWRRLREDLQPFPGRFGLTWRVALLCALVTAAAMMLRVPEAAISCYLVIFLMKEDAVQSSVMAMGLILLASVIAVIMIPIINFSIDSPATRLAVMFLASFLFLFLSATTPLGEQAAIVGLIVAFLMTLVSDVPVGQIGNQGLLMAWKMAAAPMAIMIVFCLVLGVPAQRHVATRIADRLRAAADHLETGSGLDRLKALLAEGNELHLQRMRMVRLLHLVPKDRARWLNGAVETSYRILLIAAAQPHPAAAQGNAAFALALRQAALRIEAGETPGGVPDAGAPGASDPELRAALAALAAADGGGAPAPRRIPWLAPDAFRNPEHSRFALKTSIAAVLCYLIYTVLQWDGVHTAMITCYVAALGTVGETVRKLTLRILGCLIGAAMGALALVFVMPGLTSIGGLMGLVFAGVLPAAWVSSGSARISYAGVQIALAFLLTTVYGFGPNYEFSQASNRIGGILLGIVVIYTLFTQCWPRSVAGDIRDLLDKAADSLATVGRLPEAAITARIDALSFAQATLTRAAELLGMAAFEPRRIRLREDELDALRRSIGDLRDLSLQMLAAGSKREAALSRLNEIRKGPVLPPPEGSVQPIASPARP